MLMIVRSLTTPEEGYRYDLKQTKAGGLSGLWQSLDKCEKDDWVGETWEELVRYSRAHPDTFQEMLLASEQLSGEVKDTFQKLWNEEIFLYSVEYLL